MNIITFAESQYINLGLFLIKNVILKDCNSENHSIFGDIEYFETRSNSSIYLYLKVQLYFDFYLLFVNHSNSVFFLLEF